MVGSGAFAAHSQVLHRSFADFLLVVRWPFTGFFDVRLLDGMSLVYRRPLAGCLLVMDYSLRSFSLWLRYSMAVDGRRVKVPDVVRDSAPTVDVVGENGPRGPSS